MKHARAGKPAAKPTAAPPGRAERPREPHTFTGVYNCLTGEPVIPDRVYEPSEVESEVAATVSSCLRNGGAAGKSGWIVMRVDCDFPGMIFPPALIAAEREEVPRAVERCFRGEAVQPWRPATDDFGVLRIVLAYLPLRAASGGPASITSDIDIDINKYHNYSDFVNNFERQGRLTDAKQESVPETAAARPETHLSATALRLLAARLPEDYESRAAALAAENHAFRQQLADQLAPALNARIQAMPHDTYEEKKGLARWVNEELRRFDLAIRCPKTGQPSTMHVDSGNHPEIGRFQLEHKTAEGKRSRPVSSPELPHLELMEAPSRREALAEWHARVGRRGDGARRA